MGGGCLCRTERGLNCALDRYSPDFLSLLGNIKVACGIDRVDGKEVRFKQAVDSLDRPWWGSGMNAQRKQFECFPAGLSCRPVLVGESIGG